MKIDNVDVDSAVTHARQLLAAERDISPALKSALEMILLLQYLRQNENTLIFMNFTAYKWLIYIGVRLSFLA